MQTRGSHSVIPGPASATSPRELSECKWSSLLASPVESETLRVGSRDLCFNELSRWFWCRIKFENHWSLPWCLFLPLLLLFSNFNTDQNYLEGLLKQIVGSYKIPDSAGLGEAWESAFPPSSEVMLMLLVWGVHFKESVSPRGLSSIIINFLPSITPNRIYLIIIANVIRRILWNLLMYSYFQSRTMDRQLDTSVY